MNLNTTEKRRTLLETIVVLSARGLQVFKTHAQASLNETK